MVNDITIIGGIITVFILLGVITPFLNADFNSDQVTNYDIEGFTSDAAENVRTTESVFSVTNLVIVFLSVIKMFFWTFGDLPFWVDLLILTPMRFILVLTIARNVWVGGGG